MTTTSRKIQQIIEIKRGDDSGVEALTELQQASLEAETALGQLSDSGDLSRLQDGTQALDDSRIKLEVLTAQATSLETRLVDAYTELGKLDKASPDYDKQTAKLARLTDQYVQYVRRIQEVPEALAEQASYEARVGEIRGRTGKFGDAESSIRTVSGAVGFLGGDTGAEIEQIANVGAEIFAVAEALPLLRESVKESLGALPALFTTTGTAATAAGTGAQGATVSLGAMATAAAPFIVIGAAAAAIVGGLTLAMQANAEAAEAAKAEVERTTASIKLENRVRQDLNAALESGDTSAIRDRMKALESEIELANADLLDLFDERQKAQAAYDQQGFDAWQQTFDSAEDAMAARIAELDAQLAEVTGADVQAAREELALLRESIQALEEAEAAREALDDTVRQIEVRARAEQEVQQLIESGTQEQLEARRKAIAEEIAFVESVLPQYQALAGESEEAADAAEQYADQLEDLKTQQEILGDSTLQLKNAETDLTDAQEAAAEAIQAQLAAIDAQIAREIELQDLMENATVEQVTDRLKALEREEAAIEKMLPELNRLAESGEEGAEKLAEYRQRLSDIASEADSLESDVLPEAQLRAQQEMIRETADAEAETAAKIVAIREELGNRLEALADKQVEQEKQALEKRDDAIKQIIQRSTSAIDKENRNFMADSRKAAETFRREEIQRVKEHNDERIQILDDLNASLADAEESNNVVAFIRAQQEGEKRLSEASAQSEEEVAQRTADFLREQDERRAEHEARVANIRLQAEEAQIAQQEGYEKRLLQIDEQAAKEAEKLREQAIAKAQAEEQALEERLAAIRKSYAQEEQMIADRQQKEAEGQKKREGQYEEHQDKLLQTRAEAEVEQAEAEAETAAELAKAKADIEGQQIQQFQQATTQAFQQIFDAIGGGAQQMISDLQRSIQQAQQASRGFGGGSSNRSRSSDARRGSVSAPDTKRRPRRRTRFANEGLILPTDEPTLGVFGEDLLPNQGEAFIKFDMSKGLEGLGDRLGGGKPSVTVDLSNATFNEGVTREDLMQFGQQLGQAVIQGVSEARQ